MLQETNALDRLIIDSLRVLTADAVQRANSGHPGMAIDAAPAGYAVYKAMRHNPKNPHWMGRDRFILSAGHASMLLYGLLHLNGYDLSMDDIKSFRQLHSKTPGHPELSVPGVDASTGPLGQGFSMAVGMAMAEAHMAKIFNRPGFPVFDNFTYVLMGDGCMMEGVTYEAASLAGAQKLGKLIALYDCNKITIEGDISATFIDSVADRFASMGFSVMTLSESESQCPESIMNAIAAQKAVEDKPSLIILNTKIACGTAKEGLASSHGAPLGDENIAQMKADMGWKYEPFTVPQEVYDYFAELQKTHDKDEAEYNAMMRAYEKEYPELYAELQNRLLGRLPENIDDIVKAVPDKKVATRSVSGQILNSLYSDFDMKSLMGGSADLGPSNMTVINESDFFAPDARENANIHFGVREFAMAAACNGMALYGGIRPFCATFMVFSDYLKPAMRLSALMELPVIYILTHDSIGVGEDGATHHPIEQMATIRSIPGVKLFRPADYRETAYAYLCALRSKSPVAMALSRQNLPQYAETGEGTLRGGYVLRDTEGEPDVILVATGSEVELIYQVADELKARGVNARLVSMPCMELFFEQAEDYRESVLPRNVRARVAVEAASGFGWHRCTGDMGETVTIDRFGASAPASKLYEEYGITAENVVKAALRSIERVREAK